LVLGSWFLVLGSWFLVLGSWFLVLGSWFLVLGLVGINGCSKVEKESKEAILSTLKDPDSPNSKI